MKILYAVQATGNGHLSRAREIIPHLMNYGNVDLLVSGSQAEVGLPFLIKYRKHGLSYTFGKKGGIDFVDSIVNLKPFNLVKDIYHFPVNEYDLILNDFEPVTAWACKIKGKKCIGLSHQSSYLSKKTPRPEKVNYTAEWILRNYAPVNKYYGFHFKSYDRSIYTPVIRKEVRNLEITNKGHITVYLPAHSDEMISKLLGENKDVEWQIFSKSTQNDYRKGNLIFSKVNNEKFLQSLASSDGVITAGGFESVAEAIHLRKKVMMIPMRNQYEQMCNAEAAKQIGIAVVNSTENFEKRLDSWLNYQYPPNIFYNDLTARLISEIITTNFNQN